MKNYIGLNIRHLRSENNLQQDEFASLFNVSRDAIGTYERGKSTPKLETIQQICMHFNLSLDDFVLHNLSEVKAVGRASQTSNESDSCKLCEMYERMIEDKDKLIEALERELSSRGGGQSASSQTA